MPIARPIGQMAIVTSTKCAQLITMAMTGPCSQIADACGQSNRSIDVIFPLKNGNLFPILSSHFFIQVMYVNRGSEYIDEVSIVTWLV